MSVTRAQLNESRSAAGPGKTRQMLGDALRGHSNSLGFIRLVLAAAVIVDHAFPLGGFGKDPVVALTRGQASLGFIAVAGFFAISGYLITKSGMSTDVVQFLWRRVLRIFPAYWIVLLFTALVVAPILWLMQGDSLAQYFTLAPDGPATFFTANWTLNIHTYGIYDLLKDTTPYGHQVGYSVLNGSIWTLTYEWGCYLLIAVLVGFGLLRNAKIFVPIITAFLFIAQIAHQMVPSSVSSLLPLLADRYSIQLTLTFMYGACIAIYAKRVPYTNGLGILSGLVMLYTLRYGGFALVGTAAGAYFVLYLGARLPSALQRVGTKNDYSYGVYIYGFLVQQVLAHLGWNAFGYLPYVFASLAISLGLAWLSWHLVEKRAMALKDWGPGRGWSEGISRVKFGVRSRAWREPDSP